MGADADKRVFPGALAELAATGPARMHAQVLRTPLIQLSIAL